MEDNGFMTEEETKRYTFHHSYLIPTFSYIQNFDIVFLWFVMRIVNP